MKKMMMIAISGLLTMTFLSAQDAAPAVKATDTSVAVKKDDAPAQNRGMGMGRHMMRPGSDKGVETGCKTGASEGEGKGMGMKGGCGMDKKPG